MSRNPIESKRWKEVAIPPVASAEDVQRLIIVCGGLITARIVNKTGERLGIEIFCADGDECAKAEAIINQAIVDEQIRQSIRRKSHAEITALVANILNRAANG